MITSHALYQLSHASYLLTTLFTWFIESKCFLFQLNVLISYTVPDILHSAYLFEKWCQIYSNRPMTTKEHV